MKTKTKKPVPAAKPAKQSPPTGWLCPACGRGNAPTTSACACKDVKPELKKEEPKPADGLRESRDLMEFIRRIREQQEKNPPAPFNPTTAPWTDPWNQPWPPRPHYLHDGPYCIAILEQPMK